MKYAFIHDQLGAYPVRVCCRVLAVSPGGYYDWLGRPVAAHQRRRQEILERIRLVLTASRGRYGSPRVCRQ